MIKTEHNSLARFVFARYLRRLMKKNFSSFHFINLPENTHREGAILFTPNHFSWWDGFFIDETIRELYPKHKLYLMMLEEQLKRYKFFRRVGAFSINPGDFRSSLETIRYAGEILNNAIAALIVYPQGEIQAYDTDLPTLKKGILSILKNAPGTPVQIVGYRIQYENEKLPALYCRFGRLLTFDNSSGFMEEFTVAFSDNLGKLKEEAMLKKSARKVF